MKILQFILIIVIVSFTFSSCENFSLSNEPRLKNETDSISYYVGVVTGYRLKKAGYKEFNKKLFEESVFKTFSPKDSDKNEYSIASDILYVLMHTGMEKQYSINLQEGRKFLAKNKTRKGIIVTPSGLQYEIIRQGKGIKPNANDSIIVHFNGFTPEGKNFISSEQYTKPGSILWLIPGCKEGLQLMNTGSIYKFYLPTELAYGRNPIPGDIVKTNMAVVFEIELLSVTSLKHETKARNT